MENLEEALEDAYIDGIAKGFPEGQAAERKATVSYLKKMNLPDIAEKIEQGAHWTKTEYYGYLAASSLKPGMRVNFNNNWRTITQITTPGPNGDFTLYFESDAIVTNKSETFAVMPAENPTE